MPLTVHKRFFSFFFSYSRATRAQSYFRPLHHHIVSNSHTTCIPEARHDVLMLCLYPNGVVYLENKTEKISATIFIKKLLIIHNYKLSHNFSPAHHKLDVNYTRFGGLTVDKFFHTQMKHSSGWSFLFVTHSSRATVVVVVMHR
jgi:hypothetical protein